MSTLRTQDEYVSFCEGFRRLTKIDLLQYKRGQMERRIRTFAERQGSPQLLEYLKAITASGEELDRFLDRVTINVSQLWRNPEQWEVLQTKVLPELAQSGRVKIWSAGCSYGAEAHTLAAICVEACAGARFEIIGTDIDKRMIERARVGLFSEEDARTARPELLRKWFTQTPQGWQANPDIRRYLRFEVSDLLLDPVRPASFDLILCRNVVIYFAEDVRNELHRRLAAALRPGGYLVVGGTERVGVATECGLVAVHPFTYRKS